MKKLLSITAVVMALTLPLISLAQDGKKEDATKVTAPAPGKVITLTLTQDEAIYVSQLIGKQPTESGTFQLWLKIRKSIEEQSK
jgi:uncharacterized lipoprotein YehR (DUF1307 family)